ncbi:MAG: ATP-dependent helicase [Weeksellaceae bacterium]
MTQTSSLELNVNQQQAIAHTAGPLLIVAGAGTGKTSTLVEKITSLIDQKLATPEEILCLTFTEKAAYEMEERVDRALPYGYFQMWISTFHSFCDEVLRNDINHIGLDSGFTLMTQAQSIVFLRKHLFELELKYFRPLGNPGKFIEGLLQHFSRLRDEDIQPEEYLNWAQAQQTDEEMEADEKEQYLELAHAFETYQKLKVQEGMFDFDDLISYTLQLFRKRPHILETYRKKFKYVMIDEFQDTNIAQYDLIKLLCPPERNPNLTVVGDDSQAIYKFRGASVSNILNFMKDYPTAAQVTLKDNYRSNQRVLDISYNLIQHNNPDTLEAKLGISKVLTAHKPMLKDAVSFELCRHSEDEYGWIGEKIVELHKKQKYELRDMAILVRANAHADGIIAALVRQGIPYQFLGPGTLFRQPEIKDLISYLHVLSNLEDTVSLYRVLGMDLFDIDPQDMSMLLSFAKKISLPLYHAIEIYTSFYHDEWYKAGNLVYKEHLPLLREETQTRLIELVEMIKRHLKRIRTDNAGKILYYFFEDTDYLSQLTEVTSEADEKRVQNINKFFTLLKKYETDHEDASVNTVVEYIDMCLNLGESPLASDTDAVATNAVNILTIHAAKGLEFPVVFLSNMVHGRFPTYARRDQIPIPDALIKETLPEGDFHLQEERRLAYVAMTRAKERLYLTAAEIYGDGTRKRKVSTFVGEALGAEAVLNKQALQREQKQQLSIFDFKDVPPTPMPAATPITNFSYTQLETYKRCPLQYKYQYVLQIPTQANSAASFGSTIHIVLQKFYEEFMQDKTLGLERMLELLKTHWIPVGYTSTTQQDRMKKEGERMLTEYFNQFHTSEVEVERLECLFKIRVEDELFLTGKMDRVDKKADGVIEIIDYKTGSMPKEKDLQKNIQLSLYAIAAGDKGTFGKPLSQIKLTFYYLQDMKKITMEKTEADIVLAKQEVQNTVKNIRAGDFTPNVGPWCDFCPFRMICEAWR